SAAGEAQLQPPGAQLQVALQDIDLTLAQAYLTPHVRIELLSGRLGGDLQLTVRQQEPLSLQVSGDATVVDLHSRDTLRHRDFVKWQALAVRDLDYQHGQQLRIAGIQLDQPYARVIIHEDMSTNISELIVAQPTRRPPPPTQANRWPFMWAASASVTDRPTPPISASGPTSPPPSSSSTARWEHWTAAAGRPPRWISPARSIAMHRCPSRAG